MLKTTAGLAVAGAIGIGLGYGASELLRPTAPPSGVVTETVTATETVTTTAGPPPAEEEKVYSSVIGDFASGMPVWVYSKGGRVIRVRPMTYSDDEAKPWSIKAGGRTFTGRKRASLPPFDTAYRRLTYSPARIRYPLKRVGFQPGGKSDVSNRGKGEFVRITWEEALDVMGNELKRIKETYGNGAICSMSSGHGQKRTVHDRAMERLLNAFGGHTPMLRNPDSFEGWYWGGEHVWGFSWNVGMMDQRDLLEDVMQNTKLLVCWAADELTTLWIYGHDHAEWTQWLRELGIKKIHISPDLNQAAGKLTSKWIPVRTGTDAALAAAIAYVWIEEGTYEKDYVQTHGYGFDKWKDYVTGAAEDRVPKTPEWAEKITGIKARVIRALAREWASKSTSVALLFGGACRTPYATEWARMIIFLQAMQGLGKPGVNFFTISSAAPRNFQIKAIPSLEAGADTHPQNPVKQCIYQTVLPTAVTNPPVKWYGGMFPSSMLVIFGHTPDVNWTPGHYPSEGYSEIKMMWLDTVSRITNWNCGNKWIEAYKSPKIEFIAVQHPWLEGDALYADLIMPATTVLEQDDIVSLVFGFPGHGSGYNNDVSVYMKKCIEPVGEAKSDYDIYSAVAERLGVLKEFSEGRSVDDWIKMLFAKSGLPEVISFDDFKKKGYYVHKFPDDWERKPGLRWYYEQPEGSGLQTASGKFEFYSQNLAKYFPDDKERPPVPHYIAEGPTHQESITSARAKKYPLLVESPHPRYRFHSRYSPVSWLNEIGPVYRIYKNDHYYEAVWINPVDAKPRGIVQGDVVRIYNERGALLAGAHVTERIMPGSIRIPNGASIRPAEPGKPYQDDAGVINLITPYATTSANAFGMVITAFLAQVEKWVE